MKNKLKQLGCMMLAICVFAVAQTSMVLAAEESITKTTVSGVADFQNGEASITIKGNSGQSLVGRTWKVHQLLEVENAEGMESVQYTLHETYKESLKKVVAGKINKTASEVTEYEVLDYMQGLNKHITAGAQKEQELEGSYSEYRYFVEEVVAQIKADGVARNIVNITNTTADNCVVIEGLPYGYYIIEDVTAVQDKNMAASLCIVSTANPEASINVKSDYPTVTKKIQEDDGNAGWNDIGDYEIGQTVPYKYESVLPNMNGYSKYYYAWHDVMDEALSLDDNSVEIKISGTVEGADKEYTLTEEEFTLITAPENDVTFQIQVSNIKAIVDREFPQFNDLLENKYGQKVTVTYDAVLNEKAAKNTGRPGFENDVRLEFSNNPNREGEGQTGFTPWDTVVCFTYRLDGVKVNDSGKNLENAKFRLYYDKDCKKEVFVKKIEAGYCVIHTDSSAEENEANAVEIISDKSGAFQIYGLDGGTYYLLETEAPAGYRPILEPIEIQINPTFPEKRDIYVKGEGDTEDVLKLVANAKITTFSNGKSNVEEAVLTTENSEGSIAISVVNQIGNKLPVTGSYLMPILLAVGASLVILGLKTGKKKYE